MSWHIYINSSFVSYPFVLFGLYTFVLYSSLVTRSEFNLLALYHDLLAGRVVFARLLLKRLSRDTVRAWQMLLVTIMYIRILEEKRTETRIKGRRYIQKGANISKIRAPRRYQSGRTTETIKI